MKPSDVRKLFPVTNGYAYFNVAATAPMCAPVREAIARFTDEVQDHGSAFFTRWIATFQETRAAAAALIGAAPEEVAFLHNTSEGMNVVANGLDLGPGDSVVLVDGEFPANVYPWLRLRRKGVEVRFAAPSEMGRVSPEQILAACDASTRLVAVSFVAFASGFRLDVRGLGERLRERGILFFLDAIQGLGALPLDVARDHVDFLAADGHKWLLAPEGIGLFFLRRELLERLAPTFVSWLSMKEPFEFDAYRGELADSARRFEYGTPNTIGVHALQAALALIRAVGVEEIERHVLGLTDLLAAGLQERGCRVQSPRAAGEKSGIIAFDRPGADLGAVHARLVERRVQTSMRGGRIRAAAHVYNDESDVARLLDALPA
ncbi:MAG: aminotransferase class V-fold PLP-dependent enzyme [Planctomycetes bacterium]|nr:aminotransferase class V-fold PLP-dependent enzyme [Planctomycetota bacterium]